MDGNSSSNPFEGNNRLSAILIALFLSFFVIGMLYVFYRQFKGSWEGPGVNIHWHSTFALVPDPGERPILWDVYVGGEKVEWEWGGFRPLSAAVLDTVPTLPLMTKRWQGFSKEEEETVYVSTIIVFPSQKRRESGFAQEAEVEDYAVGTTGVRCRGLTPIQ